MAATACLLTGRERAAIATIALRGPSSSEIIAQNFTANSKRRMTPGGVRYGHWHGNRSGLSLATGESVIVVSEKHKDGQYDRWEVHCHGGEVAANLILDDIVRAGATIVDQASWLSRTIADICDREATEVLSRTSTTRTASIVLGQLQGTMKRFVESSLTALGTGAKDAIDQTRNRAKNILRFSNFGLHLSQPWSVVVAGPPNVGKSSLINSLVGYRRSITMDEPGTTRDVLHADAVIDGWPVMLSDTAGIRRDPSGDIERQGIERAQAMLSQADLVVWVADTTRSLDGYKSLLVASTRSILVLNKIDLLAGATDWIDPAVVQVSATQSIGIESLRTAVLTVLIPMLPEPDTPIPLTQRQIDSLQSIAGTPDKADICRELCHLIGKSQ